MALVGNKIDLCDDDERRPVKYKDGAKLADVNLSFKRKHSPTLWYNLYVGVWMFVF